MIFRLPPLHVGCICWLRMQRPKWSSHLCHKQSLWLPKVSVTLLLNFYIAQLEHNGQCLKSVSFVEQIYPIFTKGRQVGRDLVQEMYGDASSLRVVPLFIRFSLIRVSNPAEFRDCLLRSGIPWDSGKEVGCLDPFVGKLSLHRTCRCRG